MREEQSSNKKSLLSYFPDENDRLRNVESQSQRDSHRSRFVRILKSFFYAVFLLAIVFCLCALCFYGTKYVRVRQMELDNGKMESIASKTIKEAHHPITLLHEPLAPLSEEPMAEKVDEDLAAICACEMTIRRENSHFVQKMIMKIPVYGEDAVRYKQVCPNICAAHRQEIIDLANNKYESRQMDFSRLIKNMDPLGDVGNDMSAPAGKNTMIFNDHIKDTIPEPVFAISPKIVLNAIDKDLDVSHIKQILKSESELLFNELQRQGV